MLEEIGHLDQDFAGVSLANQGLGVEKCVGDSLLSGGRKSIWLPVAKLIRWIRHQMVYPKVRNSQESVMQPCGSTTKDAQAALHLFYSRLIRLCTEPQGHRATLSCRMSIGLGAAPALLLLGVCLSCAIVEANDNARFQALLLAVAENVKKNRLLEMSYVYEVTRNKLTLGEDSAVKDSESMTFEVTPLEDGDYRRLIKRNGQPLSEAEARKEQQKLEASIQKQVNLSESQRARLAKKRAERRRKEEQLWNEVPKAFDFILAGRETQHGRAALMVDAVPRPEYSPSDGDLKILKKVKGRLWIDEEDSQVSRADIQFIEDIRFGLGFLATVNKGGSLKVWQKKVNSEGWFPYHSEVVVNGRIALFRGFNFKFVSDFSNYRRFETRVDFTPATTAD
jgi:hypothetical protein